MSVTIISTVRLIAERASKKAWGTVAGKDLWVVSAICWAAACTAPQAAITSGSLKGLGSVPDWAMGVTENRARTTAVIRVRRFMVGGLLSALFGRVKR